MAEETVTVNGKTLTPQEVNEALKGFRDDFSRVFAMSGICGCGKVKSGNSICWACHDSCDFD